MAQSVTTLHAVECAHPSWCTPAPTACRTARTRDYLCREGHTGPWAMYLMRAARRRQATARRRTRWRRTAASRRRQRADRPEGARAAARRGACAIARAHHLEEAARHRVQARGQRAREARAPRRTLYHRRGRVWEAADASRRSSRRRRSAAEKKLCGLLVERSKIKICISFYQVEPGSCSPDQPRPLAYRPTARRHSFTDLLPFGCSSSDYLDRLVSLTLFPFALAALVVARFAIAARTKDERRDARDKRDSWLLLLSYLVCASSPPHDRVFCSRVSHVPPPPSRGGYRSPAQTRRARPQFSTRSTRARRSRSMPTPKTSPIGASASTSAWRARTASSTGTTRPNRAMMR